jgi:hypothetical protein
MKKLLTEYFIVYVTSYFISLVFFRDLVSSALEYPMYLLHFALALAVCYIVNLFKSDSRFLSYGIFVPTVFVIIFWVVIICLDYFKFGGIPTKGNITHLVNSIAPLMIATTLIYGLRKIKEVL